MTGFFWTVAHDEQYSDINRFRAWLQREARLQHCVEGLVFTCSPENCPLAWWVRNDILGGVSDLRITVAYRGQLYIDGKNVSAGMDWHEMFIEQTLKEYEHKEFGSADALRILNEVIRDTRFTDRQLYLAARLIDIVHDIIHTCARTLDEIEQDKPGLMRGAWRVVGALDCAVMQLSELEKRLAKYHRNKLNEQGE